MGSGFAKLFTLQPGTHAAAAGTRRCLILVPMHMYKSLV